jgi:DeoR/GlpR family transcriptional regulator of sugar metabolism
MTERHRKILKVLTECQRLEVAVLAEMLQLSQVTARKDLDQLEKMGLIRLEHEFALFDSVDDVGRRMAIHYEIKRRIAAAAAVSVEDGETVMIGSGSCCALLAEELANTRQDITIVTNSTFIINHIRYIHSGRIILLGGEYQPKSQVLTGSITRQCAEVFISDKFFIGADGFIDEYGFTGQNHVRAQTVRDMAEKAAEIIVLTESEKFFHRGVEGIVRADDVAGVYTDDLIPPEKESFLRGRGVVVHKVPANSIASKSRRIDAAAKMSSQPVAMTL